MNDQHHIIDYTIINSKTHSDSISILSNSDSTQIVFTISSSIATCFQKIEQVPISGNMLSEILKEYKGCHTLMLLSVWWS